MGGWIVCQEERRSKKSFEIWTSSSVQGKPRHRTIYAHQVLALLRHARFVRLRERPNRRVLVADHRRHAAAAAASRCAIIGGAARAAFARHHRKLFCVFWVQCLRCAIFRTLLCSCSLSMATPVLLGRKVKFFVAPRCVRAVPPPPSSSVRCLGHSSGSMSERSACIHNQEHIASIIYKVRLSDKQVSKKAIILSMSEPTHEMWGCGRGGADQHSPGALCAAAARSCSALLDTSLFC